MRLPSFIAFASLSLGACLIYDEELLEDGVGGDSTVTSTSSAGGAMATSTGSGNAGGGSTTSAGGASTSSSTSSASSTTTTSTTTSSTTTGGGPMGDPWINELHYDNIGADMDEGFEIAGPAGLDLSGYEVELHNGANGTVYDTIVLSGMVPDMANGYGVKWFALPSDGIQNGAPDGIALVQSAGAMVIQFLSYEGSFLAGGGAASGMMSTDIGVEQDNTATLATTTLQLQGLNGSSYADFAWAADVTASRDQINVGQTFQ